MIGVSLDAFQLSRQPLAHLTFSMLEKGTHQIQVASALLLGLDGRELPVRSADADVAHAPTVYRLMQNYPNPFNPETVIRYELPHACDVRIDVYGATGQRVDQLLHGSQIAGRHELVWDASQFASGIYIFVIQAGEFRKTMKMVLLR